MPLTKHKKQAPAPPSYSGSSGSSHATSSNEDESSSSKSHGPQLDSDGIPLNVVGDYPEEVGKELPPNAKEGSNAEAAEKWVTENHLCTLGKSSKAKGNLCGLAFSDDERFVGFSTRGDGPSMVFSITYDTSKNAKVYQYKFEKVAHFASKNQGGDMVLCSFSHDNQYFVIGHDGKVVFYNVSEEFTRSRVIDIKKDYSSNASPTHAAFDPRRKNLVLISGTGTANIGVYDFTLPKPKKCFDIPLELAQCNHCCFNNSGTRLATLGGRENSALVFDATGTEQEPYKLLFKLPKRGSVPFTVAWLRLPGMEFVVQTANDHKIVVVKLNEQENCGEEVFFNKFGTDPRGCSSDGEQVFSTGICNDSYASFTLESNSENEIVCEPVGAFTRPGESKPGPGQDNITHGLRVHTSWCRRTAFSSRGAFQASAADDGRCVIFHNPLGKGLRMRARRSVLLMYFKTSEENTNRIVQVIKQEWAVFVTVARMMPWRSY